MSGRDLDIILTHERTDFDAIASLLGASLLFPEAIPVLPRQMNKNVRDFLALYRNHFSFLQADELPRGRVRRVILVDTRAANSPKGTQPDTEYIIIDHHTALEEKQLISEARRAQPNARELWCAATGANTTILVEKIREHGIHLEPVQATMLALGIYEDTGNLTYASTTHRDAAALAWLLEPERGVNMSEVNEFLHHPIGDDQRELLQQLMDECEFIEIAGHTVVFAMLRAPGFTGELSSLAARLRDFHEPDAIFLVVDLGDVIQVVARSTTDAIDVGKVAQAIGGGGHSRASAAHLRGGSLQRLRNRLIHLVKEYSRAAVSVRQIMSTGRPQMLAPDLPIVEADELMRRFGHEGFPVVEPTEDGRDMLLGVLTRREADRALDHGLGDLPVRRFMRAGAITVHPDDSIVTLRKTMIESNWGQIPVVDEESHIVGIVTRTDLIKLWDEAALPERRAAEIALRLEDALTPVQLHLLRLVGEEAELMNYSVYVVGGFVRDLMLEQASERFLALDVDIVIEGDAIALAHRMQSLYGGRVVEHKRFGTAKWLRSDGVAPADLTRLLGDLRVDGDPRSLPTHLDFVTARTEFYTEPTVLPTVQQGSIKLDLHRRDFTVNTLALCLNPDRWGELLDFWGGLADLEARVVRVLHSLSFVDDPTRILRAVRYEQRFDFGIEARTLELMQDALELLERVTPARIRHEMERILQEGAPEKPLLRLDELGILQQLNPDLRMTPEIGLQFARLRTARMNPGAAPVLLEEPIERLYWALLVFRLSGSARRALQERFGLRSETQRLMRSVGILHEKMSVLADSAAAPSQIVAILDQVTTVAVALLPVVCTDPQVLVAAERYEGEWRHVRATLDGNDLRARGIPRGPIYGEILDALRAGRLDGTIHSREDELDLVRQVALIE